MSFRNSIIIFFIFMGLGLGSFAAIRNGRYPVALVNFHVISAKTLEKDYNAAVRYFYNALLTYGSDPGILEETASQKEIKRAVLNKLIINYLIYAETKKRLGRDLTGVTEKIISQNVDDPQLERAVKEIYGLELEDFKDQVLVAQAHREILEGRMFLKNEDFDNWLQGAINQTKVIVLLPDFYWDGKEVVTY